MFEYFKKPQGCGGEETSGLAVVIDIGDTRSGITYLQTGEYVRKRIIQIATL